MLFCAHVHQTMHFPVSCFVLFCIYLVTHSLVSAVSPSTVMTHDSRSLASGRRKNSVLPIVLLHGMGDSCCFPFSMGKMEQLIKEEVHRQTNETVFVYSLRIGGSAVSDVIHSYLYDANQYVQDICDQLTTIPELVNGFNGIGFSQGGQFLRAFVQRCNSPNMRNLISIGGQHRGVYGLPRCPGVDSTLCEYARRLINVGVYWSIVQSNLIQAQYWNNPWNQAEYLSKSRFLADINNERTLKNETYRSNLASLDSFVMVKFAQDSFVQPIESQWFGFYAEGQDRDVVPLRESAMYHEDWLGLKTLDRSGRLHFLTCDADHLKFTSQWFIEHVIPVLVGR